MYRRVEEEWKTTQQAPVTKATTPTIGMLVSEHADHLKSLPRRWEDPQLGRHVKYQVATKHLLELYASTPINQFKPKDLVKVRKRMIDSGRLCRGTINERIQLMKRVFL